MSFSFVRLSQQKSRFLVSLKERVLLIVTKICTFSILALSDFLTGVDRNRKKGKIFRLHVADERYAQTAKKRDLTPSCSGLGFSEPRSIVLGDDGCDNQINSDGLHGSQQGFQHLISEPQNSPERRVLLG